MKRRRTYVMILVVCVAVFVAAQILAPRAIDWTRSFDGYGDEPFGTLAFAHFLPDVFPGSSVIEANESIVELLDALPPSTKQTTMNYIFVNNGFDYRGQGVDLRLDRFETEALLGFASRGNTVFLATQNIAGHLADTLQVEFRITQGVLSTAPVAGTTTVYFPNPSFPDSAKAEISRSLANAYISHYDSSRTTELGYVIGTEGAGTNFVRMTWGQGHILLHANPGLFSNYGFAEAGSADYVFAALSHLPNTTTLRDEYYKAVRGRGARTPLRFVLQDPTLRLAYLSGLGGLFLFLGFGARRRQRIIPVVEPPVNATLAYVSTIGRLHLAERNHLATARRKIDHWLEYIRAQLSLDVRILDDIDSARVAARSGVEIAIIDVIVDLARDALQSNEVAPADLLQLATRIDEFYARCRRHNL